MNHSPSLVEHMRGARYSHVCSTRKKCLVRRVRTPRDDHVARLCHNSLTSDHVIIHSGKIVAIVGWSRCSLEPMVLQAALYAYKLDMHSDDGWLSFVVRAILNT